MKRTVLILMTCLLAGALTGQSTFKTNVVILKTTPMLHLSGLGGYINFNGGDVTMTQSANTLTLAGGNLALGANSLTLTGSIGETGARATKVWVTDLEVSNTPTIGGTALSATYAPIANPTFTTGITTPAITLGATPLTATGVQLNYVTGVTSAIQTQINLKAPLASPTFTGTVVLPATTSIGTVSATEISYLDNAASNIQQQIYDTIAGSTFYNELADTVSMFAFGYGSGAAADTTGINISSDFGGFFNDGSDTIVAAKVIGIVKDSKNASNAWINIYYGTTYYTAVDSILTSTLNITSTTTGTSSTTFHSSKIPPNNWVWCKPGKSFGTTGTIPSKLRVTVSGYKIPKY